MACMPVSVVNREEMTEREKPKLWLEDHSVLPKTSTVVTKSSHVASGGINSSLYCRICATTGVGNLLPIFSLEGEQNNIAEKIGRCLPIIVFSTDNLPLNVCFGCLKKLDISYNLVITALNAEETLKAKFLPSSWNVFQNQFLDFLAVGDPVKEETVEVKQELESIEEINPAVQMVCEVTFEDDAFKEKTHSHLNGKISSENIGNEADSEGIENQLRKIHSLECSNPESKTEFKVDVAEKEKFEIEAILKGRDEVRDAKSTSEVTTSLNIYGPATCDICNLMFTDMNRFDEHVSSQHLMKWQCRLCDRSFVDSTELLAHKVVEHSNELVSCEQCGTEEDEGGEGDMVEEWLEESQVDPERQCKLCNKVFPSDAKLKRHYMAHVARSVTCSVCGVQCRSLYNLMLHKQQKHPKEDWHTCNHCGKMVAGRIALFIHKKHQCHGSKKSFECNICDRTFFRESSLQLHTKAHIRGRKQYTCDCGETFEWFDAFQTHKKSHKKPLSMECVTCHKVFTNETFYKRHRYIHDPEYWDRFKCQTCQRPFRNAQALSNHMQLHSGVKPHMCDLCGRTYNRYANMLKHRKLHKPPSQWEHKCNQCEATYERMKDLMTHIERSHNSEDSALVDANNKSSKEKQFKWICRFCGKRISTKLSLQDHERIHTGLKPYICEWCGREFRSRPNLLQHHLTHTGDRKHACQVCGKKFARKSFITQHMRVHTGEKPFECNICGHRFTQAGDMRRHRRRHVEIKVETNYLIEEEETRIHEAVC